MDASKYVMSEQAKAEAELLRAEITQLEAQRLSIKPDHNGITWFDTAIAWLAFVAIGLGLFGVLLVLREGLSYLASICMAIGAATFWQARRKEKEIMWRRSMDQDLSGQIEEKKQPLRTLTAPERLAELFKS